MINYSILPHLNAILNGTSALFLIAGYFFIRQRIVRLHRLCMLGALTASCLFLISYVIYHTQVGSVRFQGQGPLRTFYFAVLLSHTVLAITVVPLAVMTLRRALQQAFDRHRRIARWTLPIWLYVSVTGVMVYFMLYHFD